MTILAVHITGIQRGGQVWGHPLMYCDAVGCLTAVDGDYPRILADVDTYYPQIVAATVGIGKCYEVDEDGTILAEIDEA